LWRVSGVTGLLRLHRRRSFRARHRSGGRGVELSLVRGDLTMKRTVILGTVFATVFVVALPFVGGGGPSFLVPVQASEISMAALPAAATSDVAGGAPSGVNTAAAIAAVTIPSATVVTVAPTTAASRAVLTSDSEHLAQKPVPIPVVVPPALVAGRRRQTEERRVASPCKPLASPAPARGPVAEAPPGSPMASARG
jgi:hypothetical protein